MRGVPFTRQKRNGGCPPRPRRSIHGNHLTVPQSVRTYNVQTWRLLIPRRARHATPREIDVLGVHTGLVRLETITLVEWPEIISDKPKKIIELYFTYENDFQKRSLEIISEYKKEIINEFK